MTSTQGRLTVPTYSKYYVGGRWVEPHGGDHIDVISPSTEEIIDQVPAATTEDIDRAVAAARQAFDGPLRNTTAQERAVLLHRIADESERRVPEFAHVFAAEIGAPLPVGQAFHAMPVGMLRQNAELLKQMALNEERTDGDATYTIAREPVGVVGAIIPWNGPVAEPTRVAPCWIVLSTSE